MAHGTVKLAVPFTSLLDTVAELSLKDKRRLLSLLEEQIAQADEEKLDRDPKVRAEIQEARAAYRAGDYVSVDEYVARRDKKKR